MVLCKTIRGDYYSYSKVYLYCDYYYTHKLFLSRGILNNSRKQNPAQCLISEPYYGKCCIVNCKAVLLRDHMKRYRGRGYLEGYREG